MILNIWGVEENLETGAGKIYDDAWHLIATKERVAIIYTSKKGKMGLVVRNKNDLSLFLAYPRISSNSLLKKMLEPLFHEVTPSILLNIGSLIFSLYCLIRLRKLISKAKVIHTYNFWFAFLSVFFPSVSGKVVYTELGGEWMQIAQRRASFLIRFRYLYMARNTFKHIRRIIAQSELNRLAMIACGNDGSRIKVVRHGRSDPKVFHPTSPKKLSPFQVLYVGRIVPEKGLHILVEAANQLVNVRGYKDMIFVVVGPVGGFGYRGSTSYFEGVKLKIRRYGLMERFEFRNFVSLEDLIGLYSASSVYVLPSLQDALPFSVIEAMMCCSPVIGTKSGGMVEQIEDGKTGFLVEPGNALELADAIEYFLKQRGECNRMGVEARNRALALFSSDNFWLDLYSAIVE